MRPLPSPTQGGKQLAPLLTPRLHRPDSPTLERGDIWEHIAASLPRPVSPAAERGESPLSTVSRAKGISPRQLPYRLYGEAQQRFEKEFGVERRRRDLLAAKAKVAQELRREEKREQQKAEERRAQSPVRATSPTADPRHLEQLATPRTRHRKWVGALGACVDVGSPGPAAYSPSLSHKDTSATWSMGARQAWSSKDKANVVESPGPKYMMPSNFGSPSPSSKGRLRA